MKSFESQPAAFAIIFNIDLNFFLASGIFKAMLINKLIEVGLSRLTELYIFFLIGLKRLLL